MHDAAGTLHEQQHRVRVLNGVPRVVARQRKTAELKRVFPLQPQPRA